MVARGWGRGWGVTRTRLSSRSLHNIVNVLDVNNVCMFKELKW